MQPPSVQPRRAAWPLRLLVTGVFLLFGGAVLLGSQASTINEALDPQQNHVFEGNQTGITTFNLSSGCYRVFQDESSANISVALMSVDGAAIAGDAIPQQPCKLDFQPISSSGVKFQEIASWNLANSSEYALEITCSRDCDQWTIYFSSIHSFEEKIFSATWLLIGGGMCCLGIVLTPIAFIFYMSFKNPPQPKMMMVQPDGTLVPVDPITNNPNGIGFSPPHGQHIAPPFADTNEPQQTTEFVDGSQQVERGEILTTEQVYALMKVYIQRATQREHKNGPQHPTPNAQVISQWDAGDASWEIIAHSNQPASQKNSPPMTSNDHQNHDWKAWDED